MEKKETRGRPRKVVVAKEEYQTLEEFEEFQKDLDEKMEELKKTNEEFERKRGRPATGQKKSRNITFRVDEADYDIYEKMAQEKSGLSIHSFVKSNIGKIFENTKDYGGLIPETIKKFYFDGTEELNKSSYLELSRELGSFFEDFLLEYMFTCFFSTGDNYFTENIEENKNKVDEKIRDAYFRRWYEFSSLWGFIEFKEVLKNKRQRLNLIIKIIYFLEIEEYYKTDFSKSFSFLFNYFLGYQRKKIEKETK